MAEKKTPAPKKSKSAAKAAPAAKKPAPVKAAPSVGKLVAAAEAAELELATVVGAATDAGVWLPVQADECHRHAAAAVEARRAAAKAEGTSYEPGDNLARWL